MRSWLFLTILFLAADIFSSAGAAAAPKRVLLLHSFGPQFVPWVFIAAEFREQLFKQSQDRI
ncbi:hypothetical protein, partial [Bradyrhizobium sp. STM 3843]|uniref:hypothetical protein n=1 Tax=Bradyrhizobium sp. STM 3843 TaxID=551947 RepID=UPI00056D01A6